MASIINSSIHPLVIYKPDDVTYDSERSRNDSISIIIDDSTDQSNEKPRRLSLLKTQNKFLNLPDDCLAKILSFSRLQELPFLLTVSKKLNQIVNDFSIWQEVYEKSPFPKRGSFSINTKEEMILAVKQIHNEIDNQIIKEGHDRIRVYSRFCHRKVRKIISITLAILHSASLMMEITLPSKEINTYSPLGSEVFTIFISASQGLLSLGLCNIQTIVNRYRKPLNACQIFIGTSSIAFAFYIRTLLPISSISQMVLSSFFIIGGIPKELYLKAYQKNQKGNLRRNSIEQKQKLLNPKRVSFCHVISSVIKGLFCWKNK